MLAHQVLEEVVTLPEASVLAQKMEYPLDRSNLLRYARAGRLVARKSQGTWLTTRAALQALIVELAAESRGRPRAATPDWAKVEITPDLTATLTEIEKLREQIASQPSTAAKQANTVSP